MPNGAITSFILAVPQADLENLNRRIGRTGHAFRTRRQSTAGTLAQN
ncbi:MAG TPA: hypothetical protein VKP58_13750 [Candidatus Acidoferrum sp.]|nr:hypothetical protein [Candidatus Acidoferrum sp.]